MENRIKDVQIGTAENFRNQINDNFKIANEVDQDLGEYNHTDKAHFKGTVADRLWGDSKVYIGNQSEYDRDKAGLKMVKGDIWLKIVE